MSARPRIIVTGLIAQHPTLGGVTWDYLQYVLGLAQLGYDVFYFEDSGEWPYNFDGGPNGDDWVARDPKETVEPLAKLFSRFGMGERWAYRFPLGEGEWFGLSDAKRAEVLQSADLLLNVSGTLEHPDRYRSVGCMAYLDSDPGFTQAKIALGEKDFVTRVNAHDVHFTFGEAPSSSVPVTGHKWRPTRQPIVLSEWGEAGQPNESFTTVMSWTSYQPLVLNERSYGQKDVEFRKFLELPKLVSPTVLEIAMGPLQHATWEGTEAHPAITPSELLQQMGWRVADSRQVGGDLDRYRRYIQQSKAEWSVAKNGYVRDRTGWFSCRSACYLAAGRPVVVQETGFSEVIPTGAGVLSFTTIEEAAEAIRAVTTDYEHHARAARKIAEEYFDSAKVLPRLVDEALGAPRFR